MAIRDLTEPSNGANVSITSEIRTLRDKLGLSRNRAVALFEQDTGIQLSPQAVQDWESNDSKATWRYKRYRQWLESQKSPSTE